MSAVDFLPVAPMAVVVVVAWAIAIKLSRSGKKFANNGNKFQSIKVHELIHPCVDESFSVDNAYIATTVTTTLPEKALH